MIFSSESGTFETPSIDTFLILSKTTEFILFMMTKVSEHSHHRLCILMEHFTVVRSRIVKMEHAKFIASGRAASNFDAV